MLEEGTEQGVSGGSKDPKKSQRPPKPLTHKMNPEALMSAYYKSGLLPPQMANSRHHHGDKRSAPRHKASNNSRKAQERTMDGQEQVQQQAPRAAKPPVQGTPGTMQPQIQYVIQLRQDGQPVESFNMKCVKAGGTGLVVLTLGSLAHLGLRRWLG